MPRSCPDSLTQPAPVFMYGMERSGTTLLSMMVGAHPNIAVPLAVAALWYEIAEEIPSTYNDLASEQDRTRLIGDLLAHPRILKWDAPLDEAKIRSQLEGGSFADVVAAFYRAYAAEKGKSHWAQMEIATLDNLPTAHEWFPSARFVHLVRDGRDVALSHQTMPYGSGNIAECAVAWDRRLSTNMALGRLLGPDQYHLLRYEDLIEKPEATLTGLCEFIGVPYNEAMLRYPEMVDAKIPEERRWLWPDIQKGPNADNLYRWRKNMTPAQRAVFEDYAGKLLEKLGYEVSEQAPGSIYPHILDLWYFLGRGARLKRLRRRFGLARKSRLERQAEERGERVD